MTTYVARIQDNDGRISQRKVTASSLGEARTVLQSQGYTRIQSLRQAQNFNLTKLLDFDLQTINMALTNVTVKDKAIFSRQFAVLVNAGVGMVRSLGVMAEQATNPKLKKTLWELSSDVQEGNSLSDSMRKHPQCFDGLYVSMVQAGEVGGVLDEVMNRLATLLEDVARLQNQIKSALTYPVIVTILAVAIFLIMTVFVLPTFEGIFNQLHVQLPALTRFMLAISDAIRTPQYVAITLLVIAGLVFAYRTYYATPAGHRTIDGLSLRVPLFGELIRKAATARFSRTFGALSRSGVPILTALAIVRDTAGNVVISNAIEQARHEIQTGGMISIALQKERVFPHMAIQMISIGEETGEIDQMLSKVADFYENEVEEAVKSLTSIIEPLMIVVVGGMVGAVLLSMYLPLFTLYNHLG